MVTVIPTLAFQPGFGNSLDAAIPRLIAQQVNKPTTRLVSLSPRDSLPAKTGGNDR